MKVAGHQAVKATTRVITHIIVITSAPAAFMVRKHEINSIPYGPLWSSLV